MKTIFFLPLVSALLFLGCPKDEPVPDCNCTRPTDTTSHNFTWQIDKLGIGAGTILYDVAIVSENPPLVYAVGEIYLRDSTGQVDPIRYNFAIWNGTTWSIQRIPYYYQGQAFYNPIQSVFVRGLNDIWFCGNGVVHWNGNQFTEMPVPSNVWGQEKMNKIWGEGSEIYVIGNGGSIACKR
jgi:hypothetical protein